jgi:hypothetical protein
VASINVDTPGSGYTAAPTVTIAAPLARITATGVAKLAADGRLESIVITNPGRGYTTAPAITITAPQIPPVVINAMSQSSGTNYNGTTAPVLPVTVIDNDDSRIVIAESGGSTVVNENGTTDSYTIALGRRPDAGSTSTVTLTPSSTGIQVSPAGPFTFTDANWNTPVTVTVTTTNDATAEPNGGTATITHNITSTDPTYNRVNSPVVVVTVDDNDPALAVTQSNIFTQVREGGTTGTGGTPNVGDRRPERPQSRHRHHGDRHARARRAGDRLTSDIEFQQHRYRDENGDRHGLQRHRCRKHRPPRRHWLQCRQHGQLLQWQFCPARARAGHGQ